MNAYLSLCCLAAIIKTSTAGCGNVLEKAEVIRCDGFDGSDCMEKSYVRRASRTADRKPCGEGERDDGTDCLLESYGRGAGRMPDKAPCPSGLRDDGTSCWKDAHIYGKGCCCTIWGCCGGCRSGYNDDGCTCRRTDVGIKMTLFQRQSCRTDEDKYGALCYPKCREWYRAVGCCVCKPRITKYRRQYTCRSDEELYGALCYPKCREGFAPLSCCVCRPVLICRGKNTVYVNGDCLDTSSCSSSKEIQRVMDEHRRG